MLTNDGKQKARKNDAKKVITIREN